MQFPRSTCSSERLQAARTYIVQDVAHFLQEEGPESTLLPSFAFELEVLRLYHYAQGFTSPAPGFLKHKKSLTFYYISQALASAQPIQGANLQVRFLLDAFDQQNKKRNQSKKKKDNHDQQDLDQNSVFFDPICNQYCRTVSYLRALGLGLYLWSRKKFKNVSQNPSNRVGGWRLVDFFLLFNNIATAKLGLEALTKNGSYTSKTNLRPVPFPNFLFQFVHQDH